VEIISEPITDNNNIGFLLGYCSNIPEIYNKTANHLYKMFGISSAEISLLVTYFVNETLEGRND
jgi:hypothetical protein